MVPSFRFKVLESLDRGPNHSAEEIVVLLSLGGFGTTTYTSRNNSPIHSHHLGIQQRKPSLLGQIFQCRAKLYRCSPFDIEATAHIRAGYLVRCDGSSTVDYILFMCYYVNEFSVLIRQMQTWDS
ncbi:hypothetical protein DAPPUDRAFT_238303 [Daphnia pulex]|uniref:Uncharacterized protein n=1 Tax=Daphnia pulex TaxID=6669 RepID=E9G626_DAPPU|nr:hypothetical protein DAPPUDRAFT_238303 [Daphnia pulex]|eukprot:EFX84865.1 hypothetical protein DAPPUDRAFT_238303 [Daphnia pulex]